MSTRPHGYARYKLDGCRCYTCAFAASEYERNRQAAIKAGAWRVDAATVRAHIRALGAQGMGYKLVAARAGVSGSTMQRILYGLGTRGPSKTTRRDVAEKILAVRVDLHPNSATDGTGAIRRARALVAVGYTVTQIGEQIGWSVNNLSALLGGSRWDRVAVRTSRAVADAYDRLSMIRPTGATADRARNLARKNGWFPPLAWDDDTIDDPTAMPCLAPPVDGSNPDVDELTVQHVVAGHLIDLDPDAKAEVAWRLFAYGYPREHVASTLATSPNYVDQLRLRARRAATARNTIPEGVAA